MINMTTRTIKAVFSDKRKEHVLGFSGNMPVVWDENKQMLETINTQTNKSFLFLEFDNKLDNARMERMMKK